VVVRDRIELSTFRFSGFLWGSAAVSRSCGVSVGLAEALNWPGRPRHGAGTGHPSPADFRILMTTFRVTQCHRGDLPAHGNSTFSLPNISG